MTIKSDEEMLAEIFKIYKPIEIKPVEYRVYYDPSSMTILYFSQEELDFPYLITTKEIYETYRPDLFKISEGKLIRREQYYANKLQLKPKGCMFKAAKNDMQFAVNDSYTGEIEGWDLNG